jgi:hypothetical protein
MLQALIEALAGAAIQETFERTVSKSRLDDPIYKKRSEANRTKSQI